MSVSRRWAKGLLIVSAALTAWAVLIALTGGVRLELGPVRLSSRNAVRVFVLALLPAVLAWRFAYREWLDARVRRSADLLRRAAVVIVIAAALGLCVTGMRYGVRAAGGSDAFGYVSQSALWMRGALRIDQSFAASMPWPNAQETFAPLGYRIGAGNAMVPTYAPGLPLLMALGRLVSRCGPFLIGPICGALLVLFTFQLGRRVFGLGPAAAAALLVACSPVVLFGTFSPMADVPAAAFWTGALAVATGSSRRAALCAGVMAGIAVVIRPNLAPLAIFPWLMMIVRGQGVRPIAERTALYAIGSVPGALFIAWTNDLLYGSPLTSGYGALAPGFALAYAPTNVKHYAAWWWETQGPAGFLFMAIVVRRRSDPRLTPTSREVNILLGFAATVLVLYLFYLPFAGLWFLRFLLPAIPIAFLMSAAVVDHAARSSAGARTVALATFIVVAAAPAVRFADVNDMTTLGAGEERYIEPALHIAGATPADAVILAFHHSGNIRYYTGRLTLRWDLIDPAWIDRAIDALHERGIRTFLLMESWEEAQFRERFQGRPVLRLLDGGPVATARDGDIRFYSLNADSDGTRSPVAIPVRRDRSCLDMSPDFLRPPAMLRLQPDR